ncbi:MAG: uroporphyrinogen decarboxylase [Verrucomicrobiae bacterium]|nr:uroporphyrinogen decarboxylase [Verrucomicrobiae bacterium]
MRRLASFSIALQDGDVLNDPILLRLYQGYDVPRPPVWMMRQAGRYLPQFRELRARFDFLTLCKTPELAARVTVQPVEELDVDGAVIFCDILVLLEAMGLPVVFAGDRGPQIEAPLRDEGDLARIHAPDPARNLAYLDKAIRMAAKSLHGRNVPVIGFSGAPFTLACYAVEGQTSRDFYKMRRLMRGNPGAFRRLLDLLADGVIDHLKAQVEAGAAMVQLFDTWGGLLGQNEYRLHVLPVMQRIVDAFKPGRTPVILYVNGSSALLDVMRETGADALSVDWRTPLSQVRKKVGEKIILQGNLDPAALYSSPPDIRKAVLAMWEDHPRQRWIVNLGHGIPPDVPLEHARVFIQAVKALRYPCQDGDRTV